MGSNTDACALAGDPAARKPLWVAHERAAHYRDQAKQFVRMAATEVQSDARERLLELARQYDSLAMRLAAARRADLR
jgi:predicted kinase